MKKILFTGLLAAGLFSLSSYGSSKTELSISDTERHRLLHKVIEATKDKGVDFQEGLREEISDLLKIYFGLKADVYEDYDFVTQECEGAAGTSFCRFEFIRKAHRAQVGWIVYNLDLSLRNDTGKLVSVDLSKR